MDGWTEFLAVTLDLKLSSAVSRALSDLQMNSIQL